MAKQRIRVGVLFGGRSCEHEVSLQSARGIINAIDRDNYDVIPIGVTKSGQWIKLSDPLLGVDRPVEDKDGDAVTLLPNPGEHSLMAMNDGAGSLPPLDVIFPIIHGPMGEDGTVQGLFELAGVAYVGSGVLGSAAGMDKAVMKALFQQAGLPVGAYRAVLRRSWRQDPQKIQAGCEKDLAYPCFIKPANMGSSVGVHKVHDAREFAAAMNDAARYDRKILVEAAITDAMEIEVAVLGNDEPEASVPGEILPSNEFYDYNAKYIDGKSGLIIPAELPQAVTRRLQALAVSAFQALDCAGLARVDFLVKRESHDIYLLEANTLPGFTPISMYPKLWEASGLSYSGLIERLIELALERHRERQQNQTSFTALPPARD